jgi:hypothetical protein
MDAFRVREHDWNLLAKLCRDFKPALGTGPLPALKHGIRGEVSLICFEQPVLV